MPCSSGYAHLSKSSNVSARSAVGAESEQHQGSLGEEAEAVQTPEALSRPRDAFVNVAQDPEDEDEDDCDSIVDSQVVDKTYNQLVQYVYEQYDESRPRSDPSSPLLCDFESCFAVAEPHSLSRPRMRVYPRFSELLAQSHECSVKFARESKPLHKVILLCRWVFAVADEQSFSSPRRLNPDFALITGNKTICEDAC